MEKLIEVVDEKKGIMRITTEDERFYCRQETDKKTGLPYIDFRPSITWKAGFCPKGHGYIEYVNRIGLENATKEMVAAGIKGSKVHQATEDIEQGFPIDIRTNQYLNTKTGENESLKPNEIEGILSFRDWLDEVKPECLAIEMTLWNDTDAGTLDRIYRMDYAGNKALKFHPMKGIYIVDFKTAKYIWNYTRAQISRYGHSNIDYKALNITKAEWDARKLAILQLGYPMNKRKYKFTEIEDCHSLYEAASTFWADENAGSQPKQIELPLVIESECRKQK